MPAYFLYFCSWGNKYIMLRKFVDYIRAFVHLLFPRLCLVCGDALVTGEKFVCSGCLMDFPYDYLGSERLERKWNKVFPVEGVYSLFLYNHDSPYRKIIHALKYHSREEVGNWLGRWLAARVLRELRVDAIIPVPLHYKRQARRGYNQSVLIAEGIRDILGGEIYEDVLRRVVNNPSQTKMNFEDRSRNVENIFQLQDARTLEGKHVLLLDDVITSGATIGACLRELKKIPGIRVSVACIGRATTA